jgi:hypothetical protein
MTLVKTSFEILGQLKALLQQLNEQEYQQPLNVLSGNSIGKHVRHVLAKWHCFA